MQVIAELKKILAQLKESSQLSKVLHVTETTSKTGTFTDTPFDIRNFNVVLISTDGDITDLTYKTKDLDGYESIDTLVQAIPKIVGTFEKFFLTNSTGEAGKIVYIDKFRFENPSIIPALQHGTTQATTISIGDVDFRGIVEAGSVSVLNQANDSDWFGTNITPTTTPCMHRVEILLRTGTQKVRYELDDSGLSTTDTEADFNDSVALKNKTGYFFDIPLLSGQSYNIQHDTAAMSVECHIIEYPNFSG